MRPIVAAVTVIPARAQDVLSVLREGAEALEGGEPCGERRRAAAARLRAIEDLVVRNTPPRRDVVEALWS